MFLPSLPSKAALQLPSRSILCFPTACRPKWRTFLKCTATFPRWEQLTQGFSGCWGSWASMSFLSSREIHRILEWNTWNEIPHCSISRSLHAVFVGKMNLVGSSHESNFIRIELRIVAFHGRIINSPSTKMAGQPAACSLEKDTPLVWLDTSLLLCNRKLHQASALKTSSFSTSSWQTSAELHDCFHICLI